MSYSREEDLKTFGSVPHTIVQKTLKIMYFYDDFVTILELDSVSLHLLSFN